MIHLRTVFRDLLRRDNGQAIVVCAVALTVMLAFAGFALDAGRAYFAFRQLQASSDAAALAGAKSLPASNAAATASAYSGINNAANALTALPNVSMVSGYPKVVCLNTLKNQGMACVAPANGNAVAVAQTVTLNTYFLKMVGKKTISITASATAAMRGGTPTPYNVAIIMDQTLSMNTYDADCGATQGSCALSGVQVLLQALSPCPTNSPTCTISGGKSANSVDRVAIFMYPNLTVGTAPIDYSCTSPIPISNQTGYYNDAVVGTYTMPPAVIWNAVPTTTAYTFPSSTASSYSASSATYQLTDFLSDYRLSDTAPSLNPASTLVKAAGGSPGCGGMLPPNYAGVYGTYYAGALYAAQAALIAQQLANPGSQNVLVLLSDGDANSPANNGAYPVLPGASNTGYYPSYVGNCGQAIVAAQSATARGIRVYSVAYGAPQTGCVTDVNAGQAPNTTPCQTMASIASAPQYFFSDYKQTGSDSACLSSQPVVSLSDIFKQIANDLTVGRLIPDNVT